MTEKEARRQFELWFADVFMDGMDDAGEWDDERNCYVQFQVHMAWKGWQASRQQALVKIRAVCAAQIARGHRDDDMSWSACSGEISELARSLTSPIGDKA